MQQKCYYISMYIIKESKLQETITKKDVEKWNKDFLSFTKNIRRMTTVEDFKLTQKSARLYATNLETFFYGKIAGLLGADLHRSSKEYEGDSLQFYFKEAKEIVWSLIIFMRSSMYSYIEDLLEIIDKQSTYMEPTIRIHNKNYTKEKAIDFMYQKLARLGREAFESMYKLFEYSDELIDFYKEETITIEGIPTIITYSDITFHLIKDTIKKIANNIKKIKQMSSNHGFKNIFKGMTLVIDSQHAGKTLKGDFISTYAGGSAAAFFNPSDMTMNLYWSDLHTMIHELGHKYYFYDLKDIQRENWKSFIDKNILVYYQNEINTVGNFIFDLLKYDMNDMAQSLNKFEHWGDEDKNKYIFGILNKNKNKFNEKEWVLIEMTNEKMGWDFIVPSMWIWTDKEKEEYLNTDKKKLDQIIYHLGRVGYRGKGLNSDTLYLQPKKTYVSDYGNLNEKEAYAETFLHYLIGESIPELVLDQFYLTKAR